jgi:hypothetical protein
MPELSRVWATEGKYFRKNLILTFIEGLGHELSAEDAESMLQHSSKDVTVDEVVEARRSMEYLDLPDSDDEGEENR